MTVSAWSPFFKIYDPLKAGSIDGTDTVPHDNAVVRALFSVYKPPGKRVTSSNPQHTLFVGRLNLRTTDNQLEKEFSEYGEVKSCHVVRDIITGSSRGYGFVEFKRKEDADRAWRKSHNTLLHDRKIVVEWEFARSMAGWIPRRLGGGLGGKKESGQLRFGGRDRPFKKPFILLQEEQTHEKVLSESDVASQEIQNQSGNWRNSAKISSDSCYRKDRTDIKDFANRQSFKRKPIQESEVHYDSSKEKHYYEHCLRKESSKHSSRQQYSDSNSKSLSQREYEDKYFSRRHHYEDDNDHFYTKETDVRCQSSSKSSSGHQRYHYSSYYDERPGHSHSKRGPHRYEETYPGEEKHHKLESKISIEETDQGRYSHSHKKNTSSSVPQSELDKEHERKRNSQKKRKRHHNSDSSESQSSEEYKESKRHKKRKKKKSKKSKRQKYFEGESSD